MTVWDSNKGYISECVVFRYSHSKRRKKYHDIFWIEFSEENIKTEDKKTFKNHVKSKIFNISHKYLKDLQKKSFQNHKT